MRMRMEVLELGHAEALRVLREDVARLEGRISAEAREPAQIPPPMPAEAPARRMPAELPGVAVPAEQAEVAEPLLAGRADTTAGRPPKVVANAVARAAVREEAAQSAAGAAASDAPDAPDAGDESAEFRLGRIWFVRIGVVLLLTGLVLLGNYAYENWIRDLPAWARLLKLYVLAGVLVEVGRRLARRGGLHQYGEVVMAGGMAFFYYCTFAAHHVDRLRVIESPVLAGVLLFAAAGVVGAASWLRQAKITAVLAVLLASYATMLQPIGWLSCVSNLFLALASVALMLRAGWTGPGVVAMAGTYAGFFGWQVVGASGGGLDEPAVLWFLPPVWVIFAVPGVVERFGSALGRRGRTWFVSLNNAAFFLLFSLLWFGRGWDDDYWRVAGGFGALLLAIGLAGRGARNGSREANVAQGLSLLLLALVLRFDGYHLGLSLGMASVMLAFAAWRFRGTSEYVFSAFAGVLGGWLLGLDRGSVPIWSGGLAALALAIACVGLRRAADGLRWREAARALGVLVFASALGVGVFVWALELAEPWALLALVGISAGLGLAAAYGHVNRWMSELLYGSAAALIVALWPLGRAMDYRIIAAAGLLAMLACWRWHRVDGIDGVDGRSAETPAQGPPDLTLPAALPAWLNAGFVGLATLTMVYRWLGESDARLSWLGLAAAALLAAAVFLRLGRLAPIAGLLPFLGLVESLAMESPVQPWWPALCAWGALALLGMRQSSAMLPGHRLAAGVIFRSVGFLAWSLAWVRYLPGAWGDWLSLSAVVLVIPATALRRGLPLEAIGFLGLAVAWLAISSLLTPWHLVSPEHLTWRGWGVLLGLLAATLTERLRINPSADPRRAERSAQHSAVFAYFFLTLWATQMLVWRCDWKSVAVMWTALGFIAVTGGLWQRAQAVRIFGIALLALALGKVFASDVWDFTAFNRVVSFLALGLALILLGLFYHRFAPLLKNLIKDDH